MPDAAMLAEVVQGQDSAELPRRENPSSNSLSRRYNNHRRLSNLRLNHSNPNNSPNNRSRDVWLPYGNGSNTTRGWYVLGTTASAMAINFSC